MNHWLLFVLILMVHPVVAQNRNPFYQTENQQYAFQWEGNTCKLYELSVYSREVYSVTTLYPTARHGNETDSLGILFSNGQYAVSYDYKYFRFLRLKNGKPKNRLTYVARRVEDPSKIYEAINATYWKSLYEQTRHEIETAFPDFPEYYYSNYSGFRESWKTIHFKQLEPEQFKILADQRNEFLKDSLTTTNQYLMNLNQAVEQQLDTLSLPGLKQNFESRPLGVYEYRPYTDKMVQLVAEKRPDLFIGLVEVTPERTEYLFDQVYFFKAARKSIRNYETDSPVKKAFFRYRRRELFKFGVVVTAVGTLELGVIGGAVTGLVYLFRN